MRATLFVVALPLLLAGCASQSPLPDATAHASPVKANAKVPKTHHHTTLTGYAHREPVTPDAWVEEDDATKTEDKCKTPEGATDDCPAQ